jgi:hypothetical protein
VGPATLPRGGFAIGPPIGPAHRLQGLPMSGAPPRRAPSVPGHGRPGRPPRYPP